MGKARLTVAEALAQAQMIDATLGAWEETAPQVVASLGGRDALARQCEMTCIGPVPRLDADTWQRATTEWWGGRMDQARSANVPPYRPTRAADAPDPDPAPPRRRSRWGIFKL